MDKIKIPKYNNNGINNSGRNRKIKRPGSQTNPALKEDYENEEMVNIIDLCSNYFLFPISNHTLTIH